MKLNGASAALAYLVSGISPTVVVSATSTKLRGRHLQDGTPSAIVQEEGNTGDCTIIAQDALMIPKEGERNLQYGDNHLEFVCGFDDGHIAAMDGLSEEQKTKLEDAMVKGQIVSGHAKIDTKAAGATISGSTVRFPPGLDIAGKASGVGNANPNSKAAEATSRRRKLAQLVGNKYTLVVKGRFIDYPFDGKTALQISDDVFGTSGDPVNLSSQLEACSFGKLVTVPGPDPTWNNGALTSLEGIQAAPGVLEIDMGVNMNGMTKADIYNLFVSKTIEALGPAVTSLPGPFDHVIFSRQTCLTECGWAAYAYINSWGQMFQGDYISQTGVQTHEMGHNLNLAHSGSPGGLVWSGGTVGAGGYTDHTCSMGNPLYSDDIGRMCFNPAKNYQIDGWYDDAKLVLDPLENIDPQGRLVGPAAMPWEGNVVGVGEYNLRQANEPVTIKIETGTAQDYFVGFNRAAGPNSQNDLADDQVNIIKVDGNDGVGYSQSQLVSLLNGVEYAQYTVPGLSYRGQDVKVKVNSISTGTPYGTANLRIGFDECIDDAFCQSTAGSCFSASCQGQGVAGTNVLGCLDNPIPNCCGNDMCEVGEDATSCADDCLTPEISIRPDDCGGCWIRDGAMFDVTANPDADITITQINYKAYTSSGNMRVYYRPGGKAGYASGSSLTSNGWVFAKSQATCGSTWTMCPINNLAISVPRGSTVGLLVTYDNGGDVLYYNTNYGPTSDQYLTVHEGTAVNYILAGDYVNSFHNALMFSGDVIYQADVTPPPPDCTTDADCDDGLFCNGPETCSAGSCQAGSPPTCPNFCSETLGQCVDCLSNGDCADADLCNGSETCDASGQCVPGTSINCDDGVECTVDFCTPATGECTNSPNHLICDNGLFCDGAETCNVVTGCQPASNPCSGSTPFCDEALDQCNECAVDSDCDDNNLCNGIETCSAGTCVPGSPISCDDGVGCTVDTCEPTTGQCTNTASDGLCSNSFCNPEYCDATLDCLSDTPPACANFCSDQEGACVDCLSNVDCDNGLFCDGAETCNSGTCQSGTPSSCSAPTPQCDEASDACVECLDSSHCDDGVACTDDSCSGGSCFSTPNDANCPGSETCDAAAGCQSIVTVFSCSKNAPLQADACAAGNDPACSFVGESCGKGGKICHEFSCVTEPTGPTNPPTPPPTSTNPPPPTPPPTNGGGGGGDCTAYGDRDPCVSAGCSWSGKNKACS